MVLFSNQADDDLDNILIGLLNWKRVVLTSEYCENYVLDIIDKCNKLDQTSYHSLCVFPLHKQHGTFVHHYRRSRNTTWYIIYDKDKFNNIFIQHIISNHLTTDEDFNIS